MGIGVSGWKLARTVSAAGQLRVASGALPDVILARRLQDGDRGGHLRRALSDFPHPGMAKRVWDRYYRPDGRGGGPYRALPMNSVNRGAELPEACLVANFAEVWLACEGHDGPVGINDLEKIQLTHLLSLYGAMLVGVAYVPDGGRNSVAHPGGARPTRGASNGDLPASCRFGTGDASLRSG